MTPNPEPYDPADRYNPGAFTPYSSNLGVAQIAGQSLPHQQQATPAGFLGANARKKGIMTVNFYANGLAGNSSEEIDLNLAQVPLSMVWLIGTIDKDGLRQEGGGLVPGSIYETGFALQGVDVFSGALANYSCTKDKLTIKITSTNVGWPVFIDAYFYYMIFYDDLGTLPLGL